VPTYKAFHVATADSPLGDIRSRRSIGEITGRGQSFGIDELLGDDKYVFLSVARPAYGSGGDTTFLYDAEELIKQGALLRETDIARTAEFRILEAATKERFNHGLFSGNVSARNLREAAVNDEAIEIALADVKEARPRITHRGAEALKVLELLDRDGKLDDAEVLVPEHLATSKALLISSRYYIEQRMRYEEDRQRAEEVQESIPSFDVWRKQKQQQYIMHG
jgi:hypothetical protein